ncbi:endonuclease/exonuclease/phosphatase domain protein, partial [Vibrio parahaemolyticus EKP-008]
VSLSY